MAHSSLAVGLVVVGFLTFIRFDIMGLLFGDILAVNTTDDLLIIWIGGPLILLVLKFIWKSLFASTVNYELAEAEGLNPDLCKSYIHNFNGCYHCYINKNGWIVINYWNVNYTSRYG